MRLFIFLSSIIFSCISTAERSVTQLEKQVISADSVALPELKGEEFFHSDFAGKYQSLSDFLQLNAGIQIRGSGIGNLVTLSIRGSSHQQIQFIVDGHEVNDAQYGGFDINKLPLQQIYKISVIKSNSDSVGGTILIETISSDNTNNTKTFMSLGSFETYEYGFTQHLSGFGQSTFSFNRLTSNADYDYPVPSPFFDPNDTGKIEPLVNNQYEKTNALVKWKYNPTKKSKVGFKLQVLESDKSIPNYQQNRPDNTAYLSDSESVLQVYYQAKLSSQISNKVAISHTNKNETFSDPQSFIGVGSFLNKYNSTISQASEKITLKTNKYKLSILYNFKHESFQDDHTLVSDLVKCINTTSTCDIKSQQTSQQLVISGDLSNKNKQHKIELGVKVQDIQKQQENLFSSADKTTKSNTYYNWNTAYNYFGFADSSIRIGLSNALRTPTLYELFGNRGLVKSNINLKPEDSYNFNVNMNHVYGAFTIENDLFYRELSDAIVAQFSGGTGSYKNLSSANILGIESKLTTYRNNIRLSINALIQDSLAESEIKGFNNKKLAGIFHQSLSANIVYTVNKNSELTYQYQDDQGLYIDTANLEKHTGRRIHNIRFNYSLKEFTATFSIENIFDQRYKDQNNRPAPGTILNTTVQYTF
jgi:outer membrane cobalamin receptor